MQARVIDSPEYSGDDEFSVVNELVADAYAKYREEKKKDLKECVLELANNLMELANGTEGRRRNGLDGIGQKELV